MLRGASHGHPTQHVQHQGDTKCFLDHGGHAVHGNIAETWRKLLEEPVGDQRPQKKLPRLGCAWGCGKARENTAGRALSSPQEMASSRGI